MDNFKTENQLNVRASYIPIEEYYTNTDAANKNVTDALTGYTFDYPMRWVNDPSLNKAVGVRRLDVIPTSHIVQLEFRVYKSETEYVSIPWDITIIKSNTLYEILNNMAATVQVSNNFHLTYSYDAENQGRLSLMIIDDESGNKCLSFQIFGKISYLGNDEQISSRDNLLNFLRFLNQDLTTDTINECEELDSIKEFHNVWDRDRLVFHASFSDSKRSFIGVNGDFYQKISLLYNEPSGTTTFNVRFTSDGQHPILLKYCIVIVQLTFIINMRKAIAL